MIDLSLNFFDNETMVQIVKAIPDQIKELNLSYSSMESEGH